MEHFWGTLKPYLYPRVLQHTRGCFFGKDFWASDAEDQVNLAPQSEGQDCSWVMTDPALSHLRLSGAHYHQSAWWFRAHNTFRGP